MHLKVKGVTFLNYAGANAIIPDFLRQTRICAHPAR